MKNILVFLATGLGVGFLPHIPGTFATLLSLLLWWFFIPDKVFIQIVVLVGSILVAFFASDVAEKFFAKKDDRRIVIDEIIGFWIALTGVPKKIVFVLLAFIVFRIFDVLKLPFIKKAQNLNGGTGIILDDIIAGLLTNLMINLGFLVANIK